MIYIVVNVISKLIKSSIQYKNNTTDVNVVYRNTGVRCAAGLNVIVFNIMNDLTHTQRDAAAAKPTAVDLHDRILKQLSST